MKTAWISFPDAPYTQQSACKAAQTTLEARGWTVITGSKGQEAPPACDLYFADYDCLPFEHLHPGVHKQSAASTSKKTFPQLSCYSIRKSLIRKNYLANSLHLARLKRESSQQRQNGVQRVAKSANDGGEDGDGDRIAPATWVFEATCADDLDELLADELYDMREELEENAGRDAAGKQWYILKPAMADRGMGIRLLDSVDSLQRIFEEFEEEESDDDGDEEVQDASGRAQTSIVTSQLRHFVIQEYLSRPLLVQPNGLSGMHKFHLRAYVLAQGSLRVFLFDDLLALFAPKAYKRPAGHADDLSSHLTNTCLQQQESSTVHLLSDLVGCPFAAVDDGQAGTVTTEMVASIRKQASSVVAETFEACANAGRVHFQPWPYAWEVFGVDLLVELLPSIDAKQAAPRTKTWLLEVNAQPDFARTGDRLQGKIDLLFERVLYITAVEEVSDQDEWTVGSSRDGMTLCLDMPLSAGGW